MLILGYIGLVITGLLLGLLGGGGSILIVPVLVYLFSISATTSTAYSLFVVGLASLVGAWRHYKDGNIDFHTGVIFAIPAFIGVYSARRYIVPNLPDAIFERGSILIDKNTFIMLVFAVVMLAASFSMIRGRKEGTAETINKPKFDLARISLISLEGLVVGGITGFVGAGGGFLIIPALVVLAKLPMKLAVGTSLMIISAKSLLGFLGDIGASSAIDWPFLIQISIIASAGIFIGTHVSKYVPSQKLKPLFGWFVLIMGGVILAKNLLA